MIYADVRTGLDLSARYCVKLSEHDFLDFWDLQDFCLN